MNGDVVSLDSRRKAPSPAPQMQRCGGHSANEVDHWRQLWFRTQFERNRFETALHTISSTSHSFVQAVTIAREALTLPPVDCEDGA